AEEKPDEQDGPAEPAAGAPKGPGDKAPPLQFASLYVGDLHPDIAEATLYEAFQSAGNVASCRVCRDSVSRKSLCYGYVNYYTVEDAEKALDTLNYMSIKGKPCRIMWSQRDSTRRQSTNSNIFVKGLDLSIDNKALHDTFSVFGHILSCKVSMDNSGKSRGYGFVHYESEQAAKEAISKVNGMRVGESIVTVAPFKAREGAEAKDTDESYTNLYIKNMPEDWDDDKILSVFGEFGEVVSSVSMKTDDGKRFALLNFQESECAKAAVAALHKKDMRKESEILADTEKEKEAAKVDEEKETGDAGADEAKGDDAAEAAAPEGGAKGKKGKDDDHPDHLLYVQRAQTRSERQALLAERKSKKGAGKGKQKEGVRLCVRNLGEATTVDGLKEIFEPYGTILDAVVRLNDETGKCRGVGFVTLASTEEATKAACLAAPQRGARRGSPEALPEEPAPQALAPRRELEAAIDELLARRDGDGVRDSEHGASTEATVWGEPRARHHQELRRGLAALVAGDSAERQLPRPSVWDDDDDDSDADDILDSMLKMPSSPHSPSKIAKVVGLGSGAQLQASVTLKLRAQRGKDWQSRLLRLVSHPVYEAANAAVIILNALAIAWETEHSAQHVPRSDHPVHFDVFMFTFCALFTADLILNMLAQGLFFWNSTDWKWNWFDLLVVVLAIAEAIAFVVGSRGSMLSNNSVLRVLRLVRVLRFVRALRSLIFFRDLRITISVLSGGLMPLMPLAVMLGLIFMVFGIVLTDGASQHMINHQHSYDPGLKKYYGSVFLTMATLFKTITGGIDWEVAVEPLEKMPGMYTVVFYVYVTFSVFALLNVVNAIFIDSTLQRSKHDRDYVVQTEKDGNRSVLAMTERLFVELDIDNTGTINLSELQNRMRDQKVRAYFKAIGLNIYKVKKLFRLMDTDRSGSIDRVEFQRGCERLRGEASQLDQAILHYQMKMLSRDVAGVKHLLRGPPGDGPRMEPPSSSSSSSSSSSRDVAVVEHLPREPPGDGPRTEPPCETGGLRVAALPQ
ncbi:unnamed protein product, partial [Prorocentrum cordatum]